MDDKEEVITGHTQDSIPVIIGEEILSIRRETPEFMRVCCNEGSLTYDDEIKVTHSEFW